MRGKWQRTLLVLLAAVGVFIGNVAAAETPLRLSDYWTGRPANHEAERGGEPLLFCSSADPFSTQAAEFEPARLQVMEGAQPLSDVEAEYLGQRPSALGTTPFDLNQGDTALASETAGAEAMLVQYELASPTKLPPNAIIDASEYEQVQPEYRVYDPCPVEYEHQLLPQGLIYRAYLAGEKESRFRSVTNYEYDRGWIWDITLGGRVGLYRYGSTGDHRPVGFQVDIEGAGLVRLDIDENRDVDAADFRFGVPLTWGNEIHQVKLAYYHLSSHLGDEFLLKNSGYPRLNYSRDAIVLGHSYYMTDEVRLYGEVGYAMYSDVSLLWEFQFGIDYAPEIATGLRGAPFAAVNAHLREEVNYGGNFVVQAGWAWRSSPSSGLFRIGIQYFNGESEQFSFYDDSESKTGFGVWYDY